MKNVTSKKITPSSSSFGYFFSLIFFSTAIYFFIIGSIAVSISIFILAFLFLLLSIFYPKALDIPNYIWFSFGLLLGKIISPIILGVIFYLLISPLGIFLKLIGRDELFLKKSNAESYWKKKDNVENIDFSKQF